MTPTRRTCRLVTLGCKVNQYETQYVREMLQQNGYVEAQPGESSELCVVNTCTVTSEADAQGRQLIRRLHRQDPPAKLVVMGCYATREPETVAKLPGVSQVITDKGQLFEEFRRHGVEHAPLGITRFDNHQRAFVKVQDGCLLNCTYCIIPSVRPTVRSRPAEEIVAEVRDLVAGGYREIVLTGIHLGHYGIDLSRGKPKTEWTRLWHLLERLMTIPGEFRVRLSSLEAAEARDDLIGVLKVHPARICPHLHLCLQSGSDRILRMMKRRYTAGGFLERCRRIREALDEPAFTTDVIVGFPGETEVDFAQTLAVVREVGFCKVHVFPFSARAGTPAATMPDAVPAPVIAERRQRLQALADDLTAAYARRLVGRTLEVLVEGPDETRPGHVRGSACRALGVSFPGDASTLRRELVLVGITGVATGVLLGEAETPSRSRLALL